MYCDGITQVALQYTDSHMLDFNENNHQQGNTRHLLVIKENVQFFSSTCNSGLSTNE
jgi:hypothetical protein